MIQAPYGSWAKARLIVILCRCLCAISWDECAIVEVIPFTGIGRKAKKKKRRRKKEDAENNFPAAKLDNCEGSDDNKKGLFTFFQKDDYPGDLTLKCESFTSSCRIKTIYSHDEFSSCPLFFCFSLYQYLSIFLSLSFFCIIYLIMLLFLLAVRLKFHHSSLDSHHQSTIHYLTIYFCNDIISHPCVNLLYISFFKSNSNLSMTYGNSIEFELQLTAILDMFYFPLPCSMRTDQYSVL